MAIFCSSDVPLLLVQVVLLRFYFSWCRWFNVCLVKMMISWQTRLINWSPLFQHALTLPGSPELFCCLPSFWELPGKFHSLSVQYVYFALGLLHGYQTISEFLGQKYQTELRWTFFRQPQQFSMWLYCPLQWDQILNRGALFQVPGCRFCGCVTSWRYHSSIVRAIEVIVTLYR